MFSLFRRIGCEDALREAYNGYVRRHGEECISDTARDKDMVSDLLVFQQRMEDTLNFSFENVDRFRYTLKSSFEYFINVRQNKPAEYIARFVDKKLKYALNEHVCLVVLLRLIVCVQRRERSERR